MAVRFRAHSYAQTSKAFVLFDYRHPEHPEGAMAWEFVLPSITLHADYGDERKWADPLAVIPEPDTRYEMTLESRNVRGLWLPTRPHWMTDTPEIEPGRKEISWPRD